jgi:hypothetical protein
MPTNCGSPDLVLAWELQSRGVDVEPSAVYDAALLISRGRRPAVLGSGPSARSTGRHLRKDDEEKP